MKVGLRIDVDTLRGHATGVPNLYRALAKQNISGSFFFSVGPDNMGRHLFRLLKPAFLMKMLRSRAASLYGWDIILRGTIWPGPIIGRRYPGILKECSKLGHELGLHAWDHHAWQSGIDKLNKEQIGQILKQAYTLISEAAGTAPTCSAAPSWKITNEALEAKEEFNFVYNSDCRGDFSFFPEVSGRVLTQPQIPASLPTYDELVGSNGIDDSNYNSHMIKLMREEKGTSVLTIHAEAEGNSKLQLFEDFLLRAKAEGFEFIPLGKLLPSDLSTLPSASIIPNEMPGREGWVSTVQPLAA